MSLIKNLYNVFLEAVFPLSTSESELFSFTAEEAFARLPRAPLTPISGTRSIFAYKDPRVTKLIWNIKYNKSAAAVAIGGYALFSTLSAGDKSKDGSPLMIVPMPITARRRRERGFNQCELLTEELKRLDMDGKFTILDDLLVRTHHASRQTLKDRTGRLESAKGIFGLNENASRFKDSKIIIIDDVITTGSTMKEAMETFKKERFKNVRGLSLAH